MMKDVFKKRFIELEQKYSSILFREAAYDKWCEEGDWKRWATSVQSLIRAVYGERSPQYENFLTAFAACRGYERDVNALKGIFLSAKEDFEGGYVFDVDLRVSGEVFGDFLALAKQSLSEGHKDVAAVLASAALEDAMKRFAQVSGLDVDGRTMQSVVNALKGASLIEGAMKPLLDAMVTIRNKALHADWGNISDADVSSVIGYTERFLLTKFSHST